MMKFIIHNKDTGFSMQEGFISKKGNKLVGHCHEFMYFENSDCEYGIFIIELSTNISIENKLSKKEQKHWQSMYNSQPSRFDYPLKG